MCINHAYGDSRFLFPFFLVFCTLYCTDAENTRSFLSFGFNPLPPFSERFSQWHYHVAFFFFVLEMASGVTGALFILVHIDSS